MERRYGGAKSKSIKCPHCRGSGFWGDFLGGFTDGFKAVMSPVKEVMKMTHLAPAAHLMESFGLGRNSKAKVSTKKPVVKKPVVKKQGHLILGSTTKSSTVKGGTSGEGPHRPKNIVAIEKRGMRIKKLMAHHKAQGKPITLGEASKIVSQQDKLGK